MTTPDKDRIATAFDEELAGSSNAFGSSDAFLREAAARRHAPAADGSPRGLALVAALLALAIVATLVLVARAPRATTAPAHIAKAIPMSSVTLSSITMFGDSGWAVGATPARSGATAVLRTTDGARTWIDVTPGLGKAEGVVAYVAIDPSRAWLVTSSGVDGTNRVWTTADGGVRWSVSTAPKMAFIGSSLFFTVDGVHGWLGGAGEPTSEFQQQPIDIAATSDGGKTWTMVSRSTGSSADTTPGAPSVDCGKQGLSFFDSRSGWLTGGCLAGVTFDSTSDGGRTWRPQVLPSPDGMPFSTDCDAGPCSLSAPRFVSSVFGYMVLDDYDNVHDSHRSTLYVSVDQGRTWSPRALPAGDMRVTMVDATTGYAAGGQTDPWLYSTSDGGQTWQPVAAGISLQSPLLDCVSATSCWALAPVYNQPDSSSRLYVTADGGRTWAGLSGPEPSPSASASPPGVSVKGWKIGAVGAMAVIPGVVYALYAPPGREACRARRTR